MAIDHIGKWASRITNNPREEAFATAWVRENSPKLTTGCTLNALLCAKPDPDAMFGLSQDGHLTQEQATAAATVVQWLGSNVGWAFMESVLHELGFRIVRSEVERVVAQNATTGGER